MPLIVGPRRIHDAVALAWAKSCEVPIHAQTAITQPARREADVLAMEKVAMTRWKQTSVNPKSADVHSASSTGIPVDGYHCIGRVVRRGRPHPEVAGIEPGPFVFSYSRSV